jgi:hypothetical protein
LRDRGHFFFSGVSFRGEADAVGADAISACTSFAVGLLSLPLGSIADLDGT